MNHIINYGVSAELKADFSLLIETPGLEGPKYSSQTVQRLAQYLVCRNYAKACLELSYLCWAVVNLKRLEGGLLHFFWLDQYITPKRFRAAMQNCSSTANLPLDTNMILNDFGLTIRDEADGSSFTISATRINLLAALLELLTSSIKIDTQPLLSSMEKRLLGERLSSVPKLASDLQKNLYAHLKQHLPTAALQQNFRTLDSHYMGSANNVNDDSLLSFWRAQTDEDGYTRFSKVVNDTCHYLFALDTVGKQSEIAQSLSLDDEQEYLQALCFGLEEQQANINSQSIDLDILSIAPKILTRAQSQQYEMFAQHWPFLNQLPLSVLRNICFAPWQASMIQATRQSANKLTDIVETGPKIDYKHLLADMNKLNVLLKFNLMCMLALFYRHSREETLELICDLVEQGFEQVSQQAWLAKLSETTDLQKWPQISEQFGRFLASCESALKKNNKAGFNDHELSLPVESYLHSKDIFLQLLYRCRSFHQNLEQSILKKHDSAKIFQADLCIFKEELIKRHRGQDEQ